VNRDAEAALRAVALNFEATRDDLERIAATLDRSTVPSVASFTGDVTALLVGRTLETYRVHLNRLVHEYGTRKLDEVTLLDLERLAVQTRLDSLQHPRSRHGFGAQESFVNATRLLFSCAVKAGHLDRNPAAGLMRPRRRRSMRRALSSDELADLFSAIVASSRDPELDLLILALARETGCRREGIINLRKQDLQNTPSVILYEKFDEHREIPVSATLLRALRIHAEHRAPACERVFHYADGHCLTERRFDAMFTKAGTALPWVRSLGVSLHWIRYSTLTDVRMTSGERVAAAYAGHGDGAGGVTSIYTRATFAELQAAHDLLFGAGACAASEAVPSVPTSAA